MAQTMPAVVTRRMERSSRPSRITQYSTILDTSPRYLSDNPTPTKLSNALRAVDGWDVAALCELSEEFEAKDSHLMSEATKRRNALTCLSWKIEPDERARDQGAAKAAADYIDERLRMIDSWDTTLEHFASGIGPNVAVVELVWQDAELIDTLDVPGHRLIGQFWNSKEIRIQTDRSQFWGVSTFPGKFVVHHPQTKSGNPLRATMVHAVTLPWLFKNLSAADWLAFSEVYGTPWRWAEYTDSVVDADRTTAQDMLENMSADLAASLPVGVQLKTYQASGTGETYREQIAWAERKMSILYLGQTLTTELGDTGSRAAAQVHEGVRKDICIADIAAERRTIERQIFRFMLNLKFPNKPMPLPRFCRELPERRDVETERLVLDQITFAVGHGLRIDEEVMYEKLQLPIPLTPEPKKTSSEVSATVNELTLSVERAVRAGDLALVNALREKIAEALGVKLPPLTELPEVGGGNSENNSGDGVDKEKKPPQDSPVAE